MIRVSGVKTDCHASVTQSLIEVVDAIQKFCMRKKRAGHKTFNYSSTMDADELWKVANTIERAVWMVSSFLIGG